MVRGGLAREAMSGIRRSKSVLYFPNGRKGEGLLIEAKVPDNQKLPLVRSGGQPGIANYKRIHQDKRI